MPLIKLTFWGIITLACALILNSGVKVGSFRLPALGKLFNPVSGIWANADEAQNFEDKTFTTVNRGEIKIFYDERMVPHIYADNLEDALFAQGYVEASARLWQMEFLSREAAGKLSEVLGSVTAEKDIRRRKEGLLYSAEKAMKQWEDDSLSMSYLTPYIEGVNRYIRDLDVNELPLEFKLLDYQPSEWNLLHSALIFKSMTSTLASYNEDMLASYTLAKLGMEKFQKYYPPIDPGQTPVIPTEKKYDFPPGNTLNGKSEAAKNTTYDKEEISDHNIEGIGSNNWAVNARKTKNGHPILCNDPHLRLTLPSIWHEVHIVTPDFNTYGVSIPGMPGIMIGFNEDIAWGNTNVGHDFVDYYTIEWTDESQSHYMVNGEARQVHDRKEIIKVKNGEDIELDLKITDFGIVYDLNTQPDVPDIARDWIGYREHELKETTVFVDIMKSKNYDQFSQASNEFFAPAQNFLFASKQDTIALKVNGSLPLKNHLEGRFVQEGTRPPEHNYIPREHNPEIINPEQGFVSSANQVSTGPDYPYYYHGGFEEYRGKRLNQALAAMDNITWEDMRDLQLDVYSLKADYFLSFMLEALRDYEFNEIQQAIYDELNNWDCSYYETTGEAKYFEKWLSYYRESFWGRYFSLDSTENILMPEDWVLIETSRKNPAIADSLIIASFEKTAYIFSGEEREASWSEYSPKSIEHLLGIPAFSRREMDLGGCGDVLNAIKGQFGPSWRMIVELDNKTKAHCIYPGGQSGNPASRYYDDSLEKWMNGDYNEVDIYKNLKNLEEESLYSITFKAKSQ